MLGELHDELKGLLTVSLVAGFYDDPSGTTTVFCCHRR